MLVRVNQNNFDFSNGQVFQTQISAFHLHLNFFIALADVSDSFFMKIANHLYRIYTPTRTFL